MRIGVALLLLAGCDRVWGLEGRIEIDAADPDARVCEPGAEFVSMTDVPITGNYSVEAARFNPTQTIAYLSLCTKNGPKSTCDLFQSLYVPATSQFGIYTDLDINSSTSYDAYGTVTPDAQYLVFGSDRSGSVRTYMSISNAGRFQPATELRVIANVSFANEPYLLTDGQTLYLAGGPTGGSRSSEIYRGRGGPPTFGGGSDPVDSVNSPQGEYAPVVSDDELEIFFASDRQSTGMPASFPLDIFIATRGTKSVAFSAPVKLDAVSTTNGIDWPVWLSPNRCDLYYINKVNDFATLRVAHR